MTRNRFEEEMNDAITLTEIIERMEFDDKFSPFHAATVAKHVNRILRRVYEETEDLKWDEEQK